MFGTRTDNVRTAATRQLSTLVDRALLEATLRQQAELTEYRRTLRRRLVAAATYPTALLAIATLALAGLLQLAVPAFVELYESVGADLPFPTAILVGLTGTLRAWWWVVPVPALLVWLAWRTIAATPDGARLLDRLALRIPLAGAILRTASVSRLARTLGTLLQAGVPLLDALRLARGAVGNRVVADAVDSIHDAVREGARIAEPLALSGVFDDVDVNLVEVAEKTGRLDQMLLQIADRHDEALEVATGAISCRIGPTLVTLVLLLGAAIGPISFALALPLSHL